MTMVNIYNAKSSLSKLIQQALAGEEVIISKANRPLILLVPYQPEKKTKKLGRLANQISISKDFNAKLTDFDDYQ